ncbi:MAG: hypothetical protein HQL99_06685 [Magnetococcales bacterium]|nr:hypothetical protein [Magnetococcales bacterium]
MHTHAPPIPSSAQSKALHAILDRLPVRIHLGTLAALKSRGWIQLAINSAPMGTATSYDLTELGRQALGLEPSAATSHNNARTIGLEAETCEECGGSGQLLVLDERAESDSCPWCRGTGRVTEMLEEKE